MAAIRRTGSKGENPWVCGSSSTSCSRSCSRRAWPCRRSCPTQLLQNNAKQEVLRNAGLMMEAALSIRGYTVTQVKPHLESQLAETFLPQTVPAYAATETFNTLRKKYPDFTYKEATLNPTNPRDRARGVGDRRRELLPQRRRDDEGVHGRARHAHGPHALHRAADHDQGPGVPRVPQHPVGRARLDDQALRREQRLRLEAHGDRRRADRLGADGAARSRTPTTPSRSSWARSPRSSW